MGVDIENLNLMNHGGWRIMGTILLIHFTRDIRRHNVCINKQ